MPAPLVAAGAAAAGATAARVGARQLPRLLRKLRIGAKRGTRSAKKFVKKHPYATTAGAALSIPFLADDVVGLGESLTGLDLDGSQRRLLENMADQSSLARLLESSNAAQALEDQMLIEAFGATRPGRTFNMSPNDQMVLDQADLQSIYSANAAETRAAAAALTPSPSVQEIFNRLGIA